MNKSHKDLLKDYGISPSVTRIMIYDYLETYRNHPSVDMIYQKLNKKLPTLSKTTVYNVLKLFVEAELVEEVIIGSQETKYELLLAKHSHFKCDICKTLFDIPLVNIQYDSNSLKGYKINKRIVLLKGICPDCQKKSNKQDYLSK